MPSHMHKGRFLPLSLSLIPTERGSHFLRFFSLSWEIMFFFQNQSLAETVCSLDKRFFPLLFHLERTEG